MRRNSWFSFRSARIPLAIALSAGAALLGSAPRVDAAKDAPSASETAMLELGRRLFFDPSASRGGKFSCADCHDPEHGFSDPRRVSVDENGETSRHSQTLIDLKDNTGFHWDGEFDNLDQLLTARLAPVADVMNQTRALLNSHFEASSRRGDRPDRNEFQRKMSALTPPYYGPETPRSGTPVPQEILARLTDDERYQDAYKAAFGKTKPTTPKLIDAMRAYLLSIESGRNRYDEYLAGRPDALTERERRGLRIFEGKAGCAQCHVSKPDSDGFAKFTDYTFRNTGVAFRKAKADFRRADMDTGHGGTTFASADIGSFKVPTLRDVARRAPYMHDGSLETLEEVVDYYEKGGTENGRLDPKIHTFKLSRSERADLVAFLHALSSRERPGLGLPTRTRVEKLRVRLVGPHGRPVKGLTVKVTPFGDRLKGAPRDAESFAVESDLGGNLEIPMPLWTHVKLSALGYEIGYDRPLPDTIRTPIKLITVPRRDVYVEVIAPKGSDSLPLVINGQPDRQGGRPLALRRVRTLGPRHVLYRMEKIPGLDRVVTTFDVGAGAGRVRRELDLTGGMAEPLDYR